MSANPALTVRAITRALSILCPEASRFFVRVGVDGETHPLSTLTKAARAELRRPRHAGHHTVFVARVYAVNASDGFAAQVRVTIDGTVLIDSTRRSHLAASGGSDALSVHRVTDGGSIEAVRCHECGRDVDGTEEPELADRGVTTTCWDCKNEQARADEEDADEVCDTCGALTADDCSCDDDLDGLLDDTAQAEEVQS